MRFWDTSAIVPLLIREATSEVLVDLIHADSSIGVWWGTEIECLSAFARREREGKMSRIDVVHAESGLRNILEGALEIIPNMEVRRHARRLLMIHPLRAADALQLAAALVIAGDEPQELAMITLDQNLALCAQREGLQVLPA